MASVTVRRTGLPVGLGLLALTIGLLVYLTDRPAGQATWIPVAWYLGSGPLFGAAGAWLPSFLHPFAFALFTASSWPRHTTTAWQACGLWWGIELAFELAQHPAVSTPLAAALDALAGRQLLSSYLLRGRFDIADVAALTAGACAALLLLLRTSGFGKAPHAP